MLCADGRVFHGKVFVPNASSHHDGPMRPLEWMNENAPFFPFLPRDDGGSFILNRNEVLVLTVAAEADMEADDPIAAATLRRRVIVECRDRRFEGEILIDMPAHLSRVADYLNRADTFVIVREGDRHHLIRKARITRVIEPRE